MPSLTVNLPTGASQAVNLGTITAKSQSAPGLLSSLGVAGTTVLGQSVPSQTFSTSSGPRSGSYDVPTPSGLPVTASVNLANYQLSAANGTASTLLSALTGKLGVTPLNLAMDLGQHGISTQVSPTASISSLSVVTPGVALKLSDILPASILNGLPLGLDLSLINQLNLPLGSLSTVVTELDNLVNVVKSLDTNLTSLSSAQAQLASLETGSLGAAQTTVNTDAQQVSQLQSTQTSDQSAVTADQAKVSADQSALTAANAAVTTDQDAVTTACALPLSAACTAAKATLSSAQATATSDQSTLTADQATLTSAQSALTAVQQQLTTAQAALTAAQAALNTLLASAGPAVTQAETLVTTLTSTVNGLLSQLQTLLNQLSSTNLKNLLSTLTAAIGNQSLFNLGSVTATLSSTANASSGVASVTCSPSSLSVLGVSVAVPNCAAVSQALSSLGTKLDGVLKLLPVTTPQVTASGLTTTTQATPSPSSSGTTSASAALSALKIDLPQMKLSGLVDQLTQNLQTQLQQVLSTLGSATAASVHSKALSLSGITLPANLTSLANTLLAQLNVLPTGQTLQNLSTLGLNSTVASITSSASFTAASVPGQTGTSGTSSTPGSASNPSSLPTTGANSIGSIAAGLLLLVVGYYLFVVAEWRRLERVRVQVARKRAPNG